MISRAIRQIVRIASTNYRRRELELVGALGVTITPSDSAPNDRLSVTIAGPVELAYLSPLNSMPPGTLFATFDVRVGGSMPAESFPVLDYDDTTVEYMDWEVPLPSGYQGSGLTLDIEWMATSATTGSVVWQAAIRRLDRNGEDVDTSHAYDYNAAAASAAPGTSGQRKITTVTFTSGADMDSWSAGERAIVRISRLASDGGDTMTGDAELTSAVLKETA